MKKVGNYNGTDTQKVRRSILRTLFFGTTLLGRGVVDFTSVTWDVEIEELEEQFKILDDTYKNTPLPAEPMHEKEMLNLLLEIRMENLC